MDEALELLKLFFVLIWNVVLTTVEWVKALKKWHVLENPKLEKEIMLFSFIISSKI